MLLTWEPPSIGHFALATIVKQVGSVSEVVVVFFAVWGGPAGAGSGSAARAWTSKGAGQGRVSR